MVHTVRLLGLGITLFWWSFVSTALAQSNICGDPPPVANESLSGEVKGRAQLVSKYLGDAQLSGKIETSRTEIFSKYGDADVARTNAFFEYQVCVLLFADKKMSTQEKLEELKKVRREFQKPLVKKFSITIQKNGPFYDKQDVGEIYIHISNIRLKVNGESVMFYNLDKPFGSYQVEVNEGINSFEFIADVHSKFAEISTNCGGQFSVSQPESFRPFLTFRRIPGTADTGTIEKCELISSGPIWRVPSDA